MGLSCLKVCILQNYAKARYQQLLQNNCCRWFQPWHFDSPEPNIRLFGIGYIISTLRSISKGISKGNITGDKASVCELQQTPEVPATNEHIQKGSNSVDLSSLKYSERDKVRHVLAEDAIVFLADENDVGNIECGKMKIKLKDNTPVQQNYCAIPKPSLQGVMEDLLNISNG